MFTRRRILQLPAAAVAASALPCTIAAAVTPPTFPIFIGITHRGGHGTFTMRAVTVSDGKLRYSYEWGGLATKGISRLGDSVGELVELVGGGPLQRVVCCDYWVPFVDRIEMYKAGLPVCAARRSRTPLASAATKVQIHMYRHHGWPVFTPAADDRGYVIPVKANENDRGIHDIVAINFALQALIDERPDMLTAAGIPDYRDMAKVAT